ncbi:MAG: RNA polymerase sigma factor [Planctomycetota bacterium]
MWSIIVEAESAKEMSRIFGLGVLVAQKPDSKLVEAAVNGDVDGFTVLCERYYPAMVAIAHSVLGDKHLAEDAAQETLAKACRKLGQLKNKDKFAGWLAVICRNVAKNMARNIARRRDKNCTIEDLSSITVDSQPQDHTTDAVREAVGKLPAAAKELIYLRYYDGISYEQISKVLDLSEQAINGRLRRAKKKIAGYLKRNSDIEVRI